MQNANLILVTSHHPDFAACLRSSVISTIRVRYDMILTSVSSKYTHDTSYNWLCIDSHHSGRVHPAEKNHPWLWAPLCSGFSSSPKDLSLRLTLTHSISPSDKNCYYLNVLQKYDLKIDYCLTQEVEERCTVEASIEIMVLVAIFITCKLIGMCLVLYFLRDKPLVVIGDAIASFIARPDPMTSSACLRPSQLFRRDVHWRRARRWRSTPECWGAAVGSLDWIICATL